MKKIPSTKKSTAGNKKTVKKSTSQPRRGKGGTLRLQDPFLMREQTRYASPLPSREFILELLHQADVPVMMKELIDKLGIRLEEEPAFIRRLHAMQRQGEIVINRKGALCLPEKVQLIKGRVQGHADGFGFVLPEDGSPDLFLSPREMDKVLHGDHVLVRASGVDQRGRIEGKIVEVLARANTRLVGRLYDDHGVLYVVAEDKRISQDILVPTKEVGKAQAGQVVMVEILVQPDKQAQPVGRIVEVVGNYADPGMEIEIALRKHQLPFIFSGNAEALARNIPQEVRKQDWSTVDSVQREDIRHLPLVTIDGETARDFDDAVYAEQQGKGWRLIVAIADVSHYVRDRDALDESAKERGTSVYFPRRVIPMLPEQLSNGICSLNPKVERLCMVCDMNVNQKGEIKQFRFYPAVMLSHARLTYDKVWAALEKGAVEEEWAHLLPQLQTLYRLYQAFAQAREKRGAIDFDTVETQMIFDAEGKMEAILPTVRNPAHRLIEECMLAANVSAAQFLLAHQQIALFRIHDSPTQEKLDNLRQVLRECGLTLTGGEKPTAKDYSRLMEKIVNRPDKALLQTMLLRSMQQAVYSPDNIGHFGLGYEAYVHFTSPIRRYPDLLVHRAIKAVLAHKKYKPATKWPDLGVHCSMTERRADDASRDVTNWLKCFYMQDKVGEVFDGVVSAVTSFGIFVLLNEIYIEGLVHISELGKDYFQYDAARHQLVGEHTRQTYRLTDVVRVKVVRVDLDTSKIDFVLADEKA
jgi:ribonuclease R